MIMMVMTMMMMEKNMMILNKQMLVLLLRRDRDDEDDADDADDDDDNEDNAALWSCTEYIFLIQKPHTFSLGEICNYIT